MMLRGFRVALPVLAALSIVGAGCSRPPAIERPAAVSRVATEQPAVRQGLAAMGAPFSSGVLPNVSLAEGLSQMQIAVSLPSTATAGVADAVMVSHAKGNPNSLWIHYDKGIFLQIEPRAINSFGRGYYPTANDMKLTHSDGSAVFHFERIGGRHTLVATPGPALRSNGTRAGEPGPSLMWLESGYVYHLMPNPPDPADLATLINVARSIK